MTHPITFLTTFLLLFLGANCYSTITASSSKLVETLRYTVITSILSTNQYAYTIHYNLVFDITPKCAVSIASMYYEPSGNNGQFHAPLEINSFGIYSNIKIWFAYAPSLSLLKINCLVYDAVLNPEIQYYNQQIISLNTQTYNTADLTVSTNTLGRAYTHYMCFMNQVKGYVTVIPFNLQLWCQVVSPTVLKVVAIFPAGADGSLGVPFTPITFKRLIASVIVLVGDASFNISSGSLVATNSAFSGNLGFVINSPESYLFAGLSQFSMPTRNIYLGMDPTNQQILLIKPFNYLNFNFLKVTRDQKGLISGYLNNIEMDVFKSTVSFCYLGFVNLSEITTSQFSLNESLLNKQSVVQRSSGETLLVAKWTTLPATFDVPIEILFKYHLAGEVQTKTSAARIIMIQKIKMNVMQKSVAIHTLNTDNASPNKLSYNSSYLSFSNLTQSSTGSIIYFNFLHQYLGQTWELWYEDSTLDEKSKMLFVLPKMVRIETSTISSKIQITLVKPVLSMVYQNSQFHQLYSSVQNFTININGNNIQFGMDYIVSQNPLFNQFIVQYIPTDVPYFELTMAMKLVTLVSVRAINNTNKSHLIFQNINNLSSLVVSCFSSNVSGVSFTNIDVVENSLQVTVQYQPTMNDTYFEVQIAQSNTSYVILVKNIKIIDRAPTINCTRFMNDINIILLNPQLITNSTLSDYQISFNLSSLILKSASITNDGYLLLQTQFTSSVNLQYLDIHLEKTPPATVYSDLISLKLQYQFPLYYCVGLFQFKQKFNQIFSTVLSGLYLVFFLFASFCNNKLLAIQTIFLIQLAYFSLISIGLYCPPFVGLSKLRYSNGFNPLFQQLQQRPLIFDYYNLDIKSNFLSNVNVMLFPLLLCPLIYGVLTSIGKYSKSYKIRPRLIKYGQSFLFEVPLTILLFNSFNIYSSLVIQIQSFGVQNTLSLTAAILSSLLLPVMAIIFVIYNKKFEQFKSQFNMVEKIGKISQKVSVSMRKMYPLALILEFIILPVIISTETLFSYSLYIVFGITLSVSAFVLTTTPYIQKMDNIRLIFHRLIVLIICIVQIVFKLYKDQQASEDSMIYSLPIILLCVLSIGIMLNGTWIVKQSIKWIKKRGIIDHSMKMKQQSTLKKPIYKTRNEGDQTKWYPKLQYGEHNRNKIIKNMFPKKFIKQELEVQQNYVSTALFDGEEPCL